MHVKIAAMIRHASTQPQGTSTDPNGPEFVIRFLSACSSTTTTAGLLLHIAINAAAWALA
jgi:hypothetical protein